MSMNKYFFIPSVMLAFSMSASPLAATIQGDGNVYCDDSSSSIDNVIIGNRNECWGSSTNNDLIIGSDNISDSQFGTTVFGDGNTSSGTTFGKYNANSGGFVFGNSSTVGQDGIGIGFSADAGKSSVSIGQRAKADDYSVAIGYRAEAKNGIEIRTFLNGPDSNSFDGSLISATDGGFKVTGEYNGNTDYSMEMYRNDSPKNPGFVPQGLSDFTNAELQALGFWDAGSVLNVFNGSSLTRISGVADPVELDDAVNYKTLLTGMSELRSQIGGGGSGGIQSVVAGSGVSVDNTDPLNPVVSATGMAFTDAPHDGKLYAREDGSWKEVPVSGTGTPGPVGPEGPEGPAGSGTDCSDCVKKDYVDDRDNIVLDESKTYADQGDVTTLNSANQFTLEEIAKLNFDTSGILNQANSYTDQRFQEARNYTDQKFGEAVTYSKDAAAMGLAASSLVFNPLLDRQIALAASTVSGRSAIAVGAAIATNDRNVLLNVKGVASQKMQGVSVGATFGF